MKWSKNVFKIVVQEGLPSNLCCQEQMVKAVVCNVFSLALNSLQRGFIYVLVDYDFKRKMLSLTIEVK